MDDIHTHELIERYLLGELSGDILHTFNQKLATDEAFRKEVALEKALLNHLKKAGRKEWALKLKNLHQELELNSAENSVPPLTLTEEEYSRRLGRPEEINQSTAPKPEAGIKLLGKNRTIWLAAASVLLILVSTFAIVFNQGSQSDRLYQAYYQAYMEPPVVRGAADQAALEKEAFTAYREQNYPRSIELLKQVTITQKNGLAMFYLGHAYMQSRQYEEAIGTFEQYLKDYQELKLDAKWYLSLSYLKAGKDEAATRYLREVAATTEKDTEARAYAAKARNLLDELE